MLSYRDRMKRRYFMLRDDSLAYFSDECCSRPRRWVSVRSMRKIMATQSLLEIHADARVFRLVAASPDEAQRWMFAVQNLQVDVEWDMASGAIDQRTHSTPVMVIHQPLSAIMPSRTGRALSGDL